MILDDISESLKTMKNDKDVEVCSNLLVDCANMLARAFKIDPGLHNLGRLEYYVEKQLDTILSHKDEKG